jgi:hypothetical protein
MFILTNTKTINHLKTINFPNRYIINLFNNDYPLHYLFKFINQIIFKYFYDYLYGISNKYLNNPFFICLYVI